MKRIYFILILATLFVHKAYARDVNNPFYNAIDNQSFGLIESLIASGEDINMQDQSGKTALMHAAQKSSPDIVNFLINNGADVNVKTLNDVTALHYAARNKKSEIVRILIENGADIDGKDFSGLLR
jgi:ankyrin repeat protein